MEIQEFLHLIKNKKQTITIVTILFVLFSVAFTFVQPLRYSSVSKLLVIQGPVEGGDPYQVSKSNEYVASLLTQVVSSDSFFNEVLGSGFNIDKDYFLESRDKQMKLWKKTVKISSNSNGIITVKVYHNNRVQVNQIGQAIDFVLKTKHKLYHGFGDLVSIKIIEQPVVSDRPIKPNIFINIAVALVFGLLVSLTYIYLFPQSRYNIHLTRKTHNTFASDDIQSGQDEFEIKNYNIKNDNEINYHKENTGKTADVCRETKEDKEELEKDEEVKIYNKLRNAMNVPADLPVVDNFSKPELEPDLESDLVSRRARDVSKCGSMNNIINQTNQRN